VKARVVGKLLGSLVVLCVMALTASSAFAALIDFEDGTDGMPIRSTIPGLEFTTTEGWDWIYGDWRTGDYNGPYPWGIYYSNGNFFAWLGENQGKGVITFTASYATYVSVGYSAYYGLYVEAYDADGNLLDSAYGPPNTDTGRLDILRVDGPGMAYIIVHDTENYWLIDDLETDAIQECLTDADCDDGVFCNGVETCVQFVCWDSEQPVDCPDDGLFCNGEEFCDEELDECSHTGDPCEEGETCNEDKDICESGGDDDAGEGEIGKGSVGGCGGCVF